MPNMLELDRYIVVGGGLLLIAAVAYVAVRGTREAAASVAAGAVDAAGGIVIGLGDGLGLPRTQAEKCAAAKAAGDTWEASFACPAGDFLKWVFG